MPPLGGTREVTTRKQAQTRGVKRFHGRECKKGHGTEKHTSSGQCVVCANSRVSEWRQTQRFTDVEFVYECYSSDDELIYVGRTNSPYGRIKNHQHTTPWWSEVARLRWSQHPNPEFQRIAAHNPKYNVNGHASPERV